MKYPIDTEVYMAELRRKLGPNAAAEAAHREFIPVVNAAYEAGRTGDNSFFPWDLETELRRAAKEMKEPLAQLRRNPVLRGMILAVNAAYAQGQREAAV